MQDSNLTIRLDSGLKAKLEQRAALENRSVTQIVVRSLEQSTRRWENGAQKGQR